MATTQNGIQQYVKLEQRLVLLAWLNGQFGYGNNRDLLADLERSEEYDYMKRIFKDQLTLQRKARSCCR